MNITSSVKPNVASKPQITPKTTPEAAAEEPAFPSMDEMEKRWAEEDKKMEPYYAELRARDKGEWARGLAVGAVSVGAMAAGGYALGALTGVGGAIAGGALGLAAGVTAGGLVGSIAGSGKGSGGLAYLGMGVLGGAAVGAVGGAFAGASAMPIAGAIAGGLGGVAVGFYGHQMLEDRANDNLRAKHGLNY